MIATRPAPAKRPKPSWTIRLTSPVRTPRGGFAPLKAATLVLLCLPALWLAWSYAQDQLGARPVLELEHSTGLLTIRLLLITLALSPARLLLRWPQSTALRRMVGVSAGCYGLVHVTLYVVLQNFHMLHVASEIIHRFYLTIGFVAACALTALLVTSTDGFQRRMKRNWKRLHRLIYVIAALGLLHFFLQAKAEVGQAVILTGLFAWLMFWRMLPAAWRSSLWATLGLGIAATAATAGIEIAWYGLATGVNIARVFAANFRFVRLRPSAYVGLTAAFAAALVAARKEWRLPALPWVRGGSTAPEPD